MHVGASCTLRKRLKIFGAVAIRLLPALPKLKAQFQLPTIERFMHDHVGKFFNT